MTLDQSPHRAYRTVQQARVTYGQFHPQYVMADAAYSSQRTAVERVNARLKAHRKLDFVRVRGRQKVMLHALLSTITMQARALAFPMAVRQCVAKAA